MAEMDDQEELLLQVKDTSEIMIDLAYSSLIFHDKELAEEGGFTWPTKWDDHWSPDEYREVLQKLTKGELGEPGRIWGGARDHFTERNVPFLNSNGAHLANPEDDTECWLGRPEAQECLEFWRMLCWDDHTLPSPQDLGGEGDRNTFTAGMMGTIEEGSWSLRPVSQQAQFPFDISPRISNCRQLMYFSDQRFQSTARLRTSS